MARVIITCGKVCCGKTTYAEKLCKDMKAVLLSVDEMMLCIFGNDAGQEHDRWTEVIKNYLKMKALETVRNGINVIMDWGLWTKKERSEIRKYFDDKKTECEIHYLEIEDDEWERPIKKRNTELLKSDVSKAYFVDEGLVEKCKSLFEVPETDEIDVWIKCE